MSSLKRRSSGASQSGPSSPSPSLRRRDAQSAWAAGSRPSASRRAALMFLERRITMKCGHIVLLLRHALTVCARLPCLITGRHCRKSPATTMGTPAKRRVSWRSTAQSLKTSSAIPKPRLGCITASSHTTTPPFPTASRRRPFLFAARLARGRDQPYMFVPLILGWGDLPPPCGDLFRLPPGCLGVRP